MEHDVNNLIAIAADLMQKRWPHALGGFAGGSVFRGQGKPLSDIDLIVIMPEKERPQKFWLRHNGMPFDVFCHDEAQLRHFIQVGWKERRPVLLGILAEGVPVPEPNQVVRKWQRYARAVLQRGLPPLQGQELEARRYALMDQLEDYEDAINPAEHKAIAAHLYLMLLDAVCLLGDGQVGNGKWRGRLAEKADAPLVQAIDAAYAADFANPKGRALLVMGDSILARLGGRLDVEICNYGAKEGRRDKLRLFEP